MASFEMIQSAKKVSRPASEVSIQIQSQDRPKSAAELSPYLIFDRELWSALRADTPMTLSQEDLASLKSLGDPISLKEVESIYLPLSRLLHHHVAQTRVLNDLTNRFLGIASKQTPFILGIAGSVAVGKSTTARVLQALIERWPERPRVELVTTDGFLLPNRALEKRGLLERKGFPESYDAGRLLGFLHEIKSGKASSEVPLYSHLTYDVLTDQTRVIESPDILILEGLNVLQPARLPKEGKAIPYVSDFFDFSVYLHAEERDLEAWYLDRFLCLRETAFRNPESYFHRYSTIKPEEASAIALDLWRGINLPNLHQNILPTRGRARLILSKSVDHTVKEIALRRI